MTNVRDYLKEREKRQSVTKSIDYKEKIRSHKLTIFYRVILSVLLAAVLMIFLLVQWKNKVFTDSTVAASYPITVVQGATVKNLGGNILLYSKDGASCIDPMGNTVWNRTYEMQTPLFAVRWRRLEIIMGVQFTLWTRMAKGVR